MNQQARTDSTEDLLDIIRGNDGVEAIGDAVGEDEKSSSKSRTSRGSKSKRKRKPVSFGSPFVFGADVRVGLDISQTSINIIKFSGTGAKSKLLGLERMPLSADQQPGSPSFTAALGSLLGKYVDKPKKTKIWALLRTSEVDVTALKLPKMPSRRLSPAVYWQLQKEKKFDESEYVLDYRVQGGLKEDGVQKTDVITCLAKKADVEQVRDHVLAAGYELHGVTVVPAAFQSLYKIGWVPDEGVVAANVHVDVNFTCISIFSEGRILFSRTIKFGSHSLAEDLMDQYNSESSMDELVMPGEEVGLGQSSMTLEHAHHVIEMALAGNAVAPSIPGSELSKKEIFDNVTHSLDRVSRQAERTIDYYTQNFNKRCDVLHLSGEVFSSERISNYISQQLGLAEHTFEPLKEAGKQAATSQFSPYSEGMQFNEIVAVGMSTDTATLNLLNNYKVRDVATAKTQLSNLISLIALLFVVVAAGLFLWGTKMLEDKRIELTKLEESFGAGPRVDQAGLQMMAGKAAIRETNARVVCERYRPVAVISEVSDLVPEGVRLLSLEIEIPDPETKDKDDAAKPTKEEETSLRKFVATGIILSGERDQETLLTRFLANLESSVMFGDVLVDQSESRAFVPEGPVLSFVVTGTIL